MNLRPIIQEAMLNAHRRDWHGVIVYPDRWAAKQTAKRLAREELRGWRWSSDGALVSAAGARLQIAHAATRDDILYRYTGNLYDAVEVHEAVPEPLADEMRFMRFRTLLRAIAKHIRPRHHSTSTTAELDPAWRKALGHDADYTEFDLSTPEGYAAAALRSQADRIRRARGIGY